MTTSIQQTSISEQNAVTAPKSRLICIRVFGLDPTRVDENGKEVGKLIDFKIDDTPEMMRKVQGLQLRALGNHLIKDEKHPNFGNTEAATTFIVYKKGRESVVSENSLPKFLFGKKYFRACHISDDPYDLTKSAWEPKESKKVVLQ
jgi:hypothetical protein